MIRGFNQFIKHGIDIHIIFLNLYNELKRQGSLGIIEKAIGAQNWVSNIALPKSNGQVQVCSNALKKTAIKQETFLIPTLDYLLDKTNRANIDLKEAYQQIQLSIDLRHYKFSQ